MESSEDDAGTATSASRCPSAREKEVGLSEDDAARNYLHELSEARTSSCGTPAMSEDNFDGDSVPSPSAHQASTEAILDLIDDFIGDPREPRQSSQAPAARVPTPETTTCSKTQHQQSEAPKEKPKTSPRVPSPPPCEPIEIITESSSVQPQCTTQSEILICVNTSSYEESPNASSSILVDSNESCSTQKPENSENVIPEVLTEEPVVAPQCSSVQTVQDTSDTNECESLERTVKCVVSSESRDSVTVELAESTSSECSVSESKVPVVEPTMSRSPLKRRLKRPAPSDRRPDSTVSSTADSQSSDVDTLEQASSNTVAKDVSSSSDAVPNVHGITTPEEVSNVSEISICKAEPSTPLRKIKLNRPKIAPVMSNSEKPDAPISAPVERDRCQSTSSDEIVMPAEPVNTSSSVSIEKSEKENSPEPIPETPAAQELPAQIPESSHQLANSEAVITNDAVANEPQCTETQQVVVPTAPSTEAPLVMQTAESVMSENSNVKEVQRNEPEDAQDVKFEHPVMSESQSTIEIIEAQCSSTNVEKQQQTIHMDTEESPTHDINCDQDTKKVTKVNDCDAKDTEKKVPPLKINLTNAEHNEKSDLSLIQKLQAADQDSSSSNVEDSKQVPKLTIKLGNKHFEEIKSPIPKLTIKPLVPPVEPNSEVQDANQQVSSVKIINIIPKPSENDPSQSTEPSTDHMETQRETSSIAEIKPVLKTVEKQNECELGPAQSINEKDVTISDTSKQIPTVPKISIKPIPRPDNTVNKSVPEPSEVTVEQTIDSSGVKHACNETKFQDNPVKATENTHLYETKSQSDPEVGTTSINTRQSDKPIPSVTNIKPIPKPVEKVNDCLSTTEQTANSDQNQIPNVTEIKPISKPGEKLKKIDSKLAANKSIEAQQIPNVPKTNIKPIPKPIADSPAKSLRSATAQHQDLKQQVPSIKKLNIKPIAKPGERESTSKPGTDQKTFAKESDQHPGIPKLNIKAISKPSKNNDSASKLQADAVENDANKNEQIPVVSKLNIKPIIKPPEKVNEVHRKSSSSEVSESECSENDESTSTSDQASTSDQGPSDAVPKLTIKLGRPGTESEGKFYTQKNVPKLTIKNVHQSDKDDQLKVIVSQSDETHTDKVPKLTIKTVTKSDSQPLSPKLTIKPIKPPDNMTKSEVPKLKISAEPFPSNTDVKENQHVPKITIKPVTKPDGDGITKTPKKSTMMCDSSEHIPVVTKLNIKPILKPTESAVSSENYEEKVPVVSKLNIKPVIKPKDNEVDSSVDVPKIPKINIKPLKMPEESSSDKKDCDEMNADMQDSCIPVVTKLNIKPIVKPVEEVASKYSENQSSETGNSSDDNSDHIPVVTKLNIKPIVKPSEEEPTKPMHNEPSIPVVTKLNIKPLVKPDEHVSPASPKKEALKSPGSLGVPVVTKLNIKPIVKPEELQIKPHEQGIEKSSKPPLLMKINMKNVSDSISENEYLHNDVSAKTHSPKMSHSPKMAHSPKSTRRSAQADKNTDNTVKATSSVCGNIDKISDDLSHRNSPSLLQVDFSQNLDKTGETNRVPETLRNALLKSTNKQVITEELTIEHVAESKSRSDLPSNTGMKQGGKKNAIQATEVNDKSRIAEHYNTNYSKTSMMNYTLLKKLLSSTKEVEKSPDMKPSNCVSEKSELPMSNCKDSKVLEGSQSELLRRLSPKSEVTNESKQSSGSVKMRPIVEVHKEANESVTKPLEIITEKVPNQSSGQDSPRIILKINKTDHGASAKIITEEPHRPIDTCSTEVSNACNDEEPVNDSPSPKKLANSRRKAAAAELVANMTMGKRLRSSRIVESAEKSPVVKRNVNKRPPGGDSPSIVQPKESEQSILDTKRMKLEQLLSANKSLSITPVVSKVSQISPTKSSAVSPGAKISHNHSILNENSQKNGNSKLQNILSNLQAKQLQTLQMNDTSLTSEKAADIAEVESSVSTGSSDVVVEITRVDNCHLEMQEMIINENSVCDLTGPDEASQDPLEVESVKTTPEPSKEPLQAEVTPTPRKRGRPRKHPIVEGEKTPTPVPTPLPVSALEERPQRSLRLTREKPAIVRKPRGRGRGRGRGGRRAVTPPAPCPEPGAEPDPDSEPEPVIVVEVAEARATSPIDPTSSRIKLPRMTEALDKSVAGASCATPLSSRRHSSDSQSDLKLFSSTVVLDSPGKGEELMKTPDSTRRGGRGSRGGRGRTPRNRGRGRGGGRGAMYMKETMGIYGRVCGPATTTVQLFEEETCMMDDNATPSKPSHLLDEDSQSSVLSSTNDSNKMKKSKFADLFDSNKVWTAADVKEYTWPPADTPNAEAQVMMIQEQVAMFLGVKSFKRRYPELKRRAVGGDEREYVLARGLVPEALCDLGVTAVDASEVLDIMLSDYPHKYEEYRSHQRQRQMAAAEETVEVKAEEKPTRIEMKSEKTSDKPEPPKVDPEKTRQDMAAAAIASAAEWNARANAWRRPACVDLQSNTIHRRRAPPPAPPPPRVRPPHGFYPHALLPGQYQHWYRTYTADQLRYFPLTTVLAAPPAPPSPADSSSDSEGSWPDSDSSADSDPPHHLSAKRKKVSRVKRGSQQDKEDSNTGEVVETCRVCKLRLEANRKHTHERFLVCAQCKANLHPACVELPADTIRKCRSYAWQCAECKTCCACRRPQDDDKMLFCDLCDRGFHIYCVGLTSVPSGRWHCVECAICKSCGARDPNGLTPGTTTPGTSTPGPSTPGPSTPGPSTPGPSTPGVSSGPGEWHHQTRRGPGGHKVYSHSLCTPCARAYRIGRYCPLCERSFIGPKGTMQLVICKLCDRQLHQECVRQTVSVLRVLDYTCAECRRGGITSRSAAVRAAPRTIATLFMAKRRFNKYAHRQYLASRLQALQDAADTEPDDADAAPTDDDASRDVDPLEGVGDDAPPPPDD